MGSLAKANTVFLDEVYECPALMDELRREVLPCRQIGNVPLKSVSVGRFEYTDETVATYGEYHLSDASNVPGIIGSCVDVFVFHSPVKTYGRNSGCFAVPVDLSKRLEGLRYDTMWVVQLFRSGEEDVGPAYTYQKYMRKAGHFDCIPIPQMLAHCVSKEVVWTVGITAVLRGIPPQYDGFIYPWSLKIGDLLGVADFLNVNK